MAKFKHVHQERAVAKLNFLRNKNQCLTAVVNITLIAITAIYLLNDALPVATDSAFIVLYVDASPGVGKKDAIWVPGVGRSLSGFSNFGLFQHN